MKQPIVKQHCNLQHRQRKCGLASKIENTLTELSSGKKDAVTVKGNQTLYRLQYNHKIHAFSLCKFHVYRKSKISWSKTPCHPPLPLHPPSTRIHFRKREVNIATKKKKPNQRHEFQVFNRDFVLNNSKRHIAGFSGLICCTYSFIAVPYISGFCAPKDPSPGNLRVI